MKPLTPEEEKDVEVRTAEFRKELMALSEKHQIAIVAYPQYGQNESGRFETMAITNLVDMKYLPKPSPIQRDQIIKEG